MRPPINPLDRQLGKLPAVGASAGFTERVLRGLDDPAAVSRPAPPARLVWAALGACVVLLALLVVLPEKKPDPTARLTAEATEIRRQHALLTEELERLRSRSEKAAPVLYLGSDDEVDYVLDLTPFLPPPAIGIVPASNNNPLTTF